MTEKVFHYRRSPFAFIFISLLNMMCIILLITNVGNLHLIQGAVIFLSIWMLISGYNLLVPKSITLGAEGLLISRLFRKPLCIKWQRITRIAIVNYVHRSRRGNQKISKKRGLAIFIPWPKAGGTLQNQLVLMYARGYALDGELLTEPPLMVLPDNFSASLDEIAKEIEQRLSYT